jgi:hypothetical protein
VHPTLARPAAAAPAGLTRDWRLPTGPEPPVPETFVTTDRQALLWWAKADLRLPVLELLPDGSYSSVLVSPKIRGMASES